MFSWCAALWAWVNVYGRLGDCDRDRVELTERVEELTSELSSLRRLHQIGTITVDARGVITRAGQNFAEMTGYTVDDLIGRPLRELIPYRYWHDHKAGFDQVADGSRPVRDSPLEVELRCKDGTEVQILVSLSESHDGAVKVFRADVRRR